MVVGGRRPEKKKGIDDKKHSKENKVDSDNQRLGWKGLDEGHLKIYFFFLFLTTQVLSRDIQTYMGIYTNGSVISLVMMKTRKIF